MYREKIFGIAMRIETTPLTDSVPGVGDAVRVVGIPTLKWGFLEPGVRDDVITGQLGAAARTNPAARWGSIDVSLEAKGAGAAYAVGVTVPECDVTLRIGGMGRTFTAGAGTESILYSTLDQPTETATLYCWGGGKLFKLVGCVATLKYSADAAKRGMFAATITGVMTSDPAEVALPSLTYQATLPPLFHTAAATIGAWSSASGSEPLVLKSMSIDFNNTVVDRPSAGAVDGHAGYLVADRKVRLEETVELPAIATFDVFAAAKATGTGLPLTTSQLGTVQYNRMKIQTGRWQLEAPDQAADKSIVTAKLAGNLLIGSAPTSNREINFLFD